MIVVIVDMDQPGIRKFVGLETKNQFELAEFETVSEIETLKATHALGVFNWYLLDLKCEAVEVI